MTRPSLSMADEREGLWRGQKVEVWFSLTSARFVHSVFVQPLHLVLALVVSTPATSRISMETGFPGLCFSRPFNFLLQGSFASSNQRPDSLSRFRLSR